VTSDTNHIQLAPDRSDHSYEPLDTIDPILKQRTRFNLDCVNIY
jgi:hypothetical protein